MKKFLVFALAATAFAACIKSNTPPTTNDCVPVAASVEDSTIKAFTTHDTVTYTKDPSYVYYHIVDSGTGSPAPTTVFFKYKLRLLNGTLVDTSVGTVSSPVTALIGGVQAIRGTFKKGARVLAVIPSSLAYGCQSGVKNGVVIIPANSILRFDLVITDVQ